MTSNGTSGVRPRPTTAVIFVAAMLVGVMTYTGDLSYTPAVVALLLLAVGLDRYTTAGPGLSGA
jgi:hypothetical protein